MSPTSFPSALILELSVSFSERGTWKRQKISWWGSEQRKPHTESIRGSGHLLKTPQCHTGRSVSLQNHEKLWLSSEELKLVHPCTYSSLMCRLYPSGDYATFPSQHGSVFNYQINVFGQGLTQPSPGGISCTREQMAGWNLEREEISLKRLHVLTRLICFLAHGSKRSCFRGNFQRLIPEKRLPEKPWLPPYLPSAAGWQWLSGSAGGACRQPLRCSQGKRRCCHCFLYSAL